MRRRAKEANIARRSQLNALTPKWDAIRPRTLLLLCETTYAARAAELNLRREIEPQIRKLLATFLMRCRWSIRRCASERNHMALMKVSGGARTRNVKR